MQEKDSYSETDLPQLTNLDNSVNESWLHLGFRHNRPGLISILQKYKDSTKKIFSQSLEKALHEDFFRVVQANRLSQGYVVEFTGTSREDPDSGSYLLINSGKITFITHPHDPARRHKVIATAGEEIFIRDAVDTQIVVNEEAEVIQIVSPRSHQGRSLVLPSIPPSHPIRETFMPRKEHLRRLKAVRDELKHHTDEAISRVSEIITAAKATHLRHKAAIHEPLRVMFVHAHPDDESSKGAATMAKYATGDAEVVVVTCTGGEQGSILNPALDNSDYDLNLPQIRSEEMRKAKDLLGVQQIWLGYKDSGMPDDDIPAADSFANQTKAATADLIKLVRKIRPHVMVTYDETGGYPHLDHQATHTISYQAFNNANDTKEFPVEEFGEPYQPLKLYYHRPFHSEIVAEVHKALLKSGRESPFEQLLQYWKQVPNKDPLTRVSTRVRVARFLDVAEQALKAHATQVHEHSIWFALPLEQRRRRLPTEDFELAISLVNSHVKPGEKDLFTGVLETLAIKTSAVPLRQRILAIPRTARQLTGILRADNGSNRPSQSQ